MLTFYKNKHNGSSLVIVLGIMVVISIIITVILSVWVNTAKLESNQNQNLHAYYIARSGADAVASYIIDYKEEFLKKHKTKLLNTTNGGVVFTVPENSTDPEKSLGNGSFRVVVKKGVDELIIESTGTHLGKSQLVRLSLIDTAQIQSANYVFHRALFTKDPLNLTQFTDILNNVCASNSTITPRTPYVYNGTNEGNAPLIYLSPLLPTFVANSTQITTTTNYAEAVNTLNLNADITYIQSINIPINTLLTINPNGGDRIVVVRDLTVAGSLAQSGVGGSVRFFLLNSANFTSGYVDSSKPLLILANSSLTTISINTSSDFNAFIYAPDTVVQLRNASGKYRGGIISKAVNGGTGLNGVGTVDYKALINQGVMSSHFIVSNDPVYIKGRYLRVGW